MSEDDANIIATVKADDVEWHMEARNTGDKEYPASDHFEEEQALAALLANEVIFINDHWWKKEWPEEARKLTSLNVNCNDVFMWGCADSESIKYAQIEALYKLWRKEPMWGGAVWCVIQRREMPQEPVAKSMRGSGWDLDALQKEHGLRANFYDGVSEIFARQKYRIYCAWATARGRAAKVFDKNWWEDWKEYTTANPDWRDAGQLNPDFSLWLMGYGPAWSVAARRISTLSQRRKEIALERSKARATPSFRSSRQNSSSPRLTASPALNNKLSGTARRGAERMKITAQLEFDTFGEAEKVFRHLGALDGADKKDGANGTARPTQQMNSPTKIGAQAAGAPLSPTATAGLGATTASPSSGPTLDDVTASWRAYVGRGGGRTAATAMAILNAHGLSRLKDARPEQYPVLKRAFDTAGPEHPLGEAA